MTTHYVWDEAYDRKLHHGSYERCREYLRKLAKNGSCLKYLHIVSNETGRCLSWVL